MNRIHRMLLLFGGLFALGIEACGATQSPPQLQIRSAGPAQVVLGWPAPAEDFLLEETRELSSLGRWLPVAQVPTMTDGWYILGMPCTEPIRFFRLRYEPSALRSPQSAISFALVAPDGGSVAAGQPFSIELRASFNAVLAAAAVRISVSGSAEAMLTGRSANPAQSNGLMFVSSTSQEPFESGLPVSLTGEGSLEVLLGGGAWPFDGAAPGDDVLLERLEVTPTSEGDLTISLAAAEAVTSRWAQDGMFFEWVGINPWSSAVTVNAQGDAMRAGDGVRAVSTVEAFGQRGQPAPTVDPNADEQGAVDLADLVYVRARLGADPAMPENAGADVNDDGEIDLLDLVAVRNRLTQPPVQVSETVTLNEVAPNPAPEEAPWIEMKYRGNTTTMLMTLEIRNGLQQVLLAPGEMIPAKPGSFIVVTFDGLVWLEYLGGGSEDYTGVRLHCPKLDAAFNPTDDQCLLYLDGELVDSVKWGHFPEGKAALNTELFPVPLGGSIGQDGYEQDRWVRFATPTPGAENGLPTPLLYFPPDGTGVERAESTHFGWVDPRCAPVAYELEVDDGDDFETPLVQVSSMGASYELSPGLTPGKYFWRVRARAGELSSVWSAPKSLEVIELPTPPQSRRVASQPAAKTSTMGSIYGFAYLRDEHLFDGPRKDSRMICLECDHEADPDAWDREHGHLGTCPHDVGHGATAIARDLNIYYLMSQPRTGTTGDVVTQDEINYDIFQDPTSTPAGDLGHGQVADLQKALQAALAPNAIIPYAFAPHQSDMIWEYYKRIIDDRIPMVGQITLKTGVSLGTVILMGYEEYDDASGNLIRKVGAYSPFTGCVFYFSITDLPTTDVPTVYALSDAPGAAKPVHLSDPDIARDTDKDGLCDFDEWARFDTDKTKPDTDGDGIQDKTEVWSYKFGKGWAPRSADPDGDGLRAESDPDTDNDGCLDGDEDRNHDGSLYWPPGLAMGVKVKEENETDPFWVDEFKVTLTADRTTLHFKEQTHLEVKVTDKDDKPLKDVMMRLRMDPVIGTFGAAGSPPVQTVFLQTDQDGKATADFSAEETEGTVNLEARYMPCPQGKESKAELKIDILPYDWIFAVQEKAVLTGPTVTNEYTITIVYPGWPSPVEGQGEADTWKDQGFQKVSGHFNHPKTTKPGLWIERVEVSDSNAQLSIDGQPVGQSWVRANELQNPTSWEVSVATSLLESFPRYLLVTTIGGPERKTPLVWWSECYIMNSRRRTGRGTTSGQGFLLTFDYHNHDYMFFFGDGDENGHDPVWTWPKEQHTSVSFIPVAGLGGYEMGTYGGQFFPPDDWWNPVRSGICEYYNNFAAKYAVSWMPPTLWTSRDITDEFYLMEDDLTNAGPLLPVDFLNGIRFKRDYIGNELKELQQRNLDPPQYEIEMLPGE